MRRAFSAPTGSRCRADSSVCCGGTEAGEYCGCVQLTQANLPSRYLGDSPVLPLFTQRRSPSGKGARGAEFPIRKGGLATSSPHPSHALERARVVRNLG